MIRETVLVVGVALFAGAANADRPSSFADSRGYQSCVNAAARAVSLLLVEPRYFINEREPEGARLYYLNAFTRTNGSKDPNGRPDRVRIACQTAASGHRVLEMSVDDGRFAARMSPSADVVSN